MRIRRTGFLTKIVVLALLIAAATGVLNLRGKIQQARSDLEDWTAQVAAQTQINADLADAVENSGDPERQADIARDKLDLVEPGEQVIYFTD